MLIMIMMMRMDGFMLLLLACVVLVLGDVIVMNVYFTIVKKSCVRRINMYTLPFW